MKVTRSKRFGVGLGVGIFSVAALAAGVSLRTNDQARDEGAPAIRRPVQTEPCGAHSERMSVEEVAERVGFEPLVPDHPRANDDLLESAWFCRPDGMRLVYTNDINIALGSADGPKADSVAGWTRFANDSDSAFMSEVRGTSALVGGPTPDAKAALGGVLFMEGSVIVHVIGNGSVDVSELMEIAESLAPSS